MERHNVPTKIVFGVVIPLCLIGVVICNLMIGEVYCIRTVHRSTRLAWANESTEVAFWVSFKVATSIALVSWFLLSDHPKTERLSLQGLYLAAAIVLVTAVTSFVIAVAF